MVAVLTWPWVTSRRRLSVIILLNVLLLHVYFWSLDEAHHVVIRVDNGRVSATVDGDSSMPQSRVHGQWIGFQASDYASYRIQATGEAIQTDTQSVFGRLAETFRLAQPGAAWTGLSVATRGGRLIRPAFAQDYLPAGSWSLDRRGEWQGAPGSYALFGPIFASSYTLSLEAVRPDGTQTVLVGVDGRGHGIALQLRFDQPDAIWLTWSNGSFVGGLGGMPLHRLSFVPDLQRVARVNLTPYLFALILLALSYGCYSLLSVALHSLPFLEYRPPAWQLFRRHRTLTKLFFFLIVFAGLLETGLVSTYLLHRMPHVQDSVAYLFQAKIFALGAFHVVAPPVAIRSFFFEQFVPFYRDQWFSQYPPGHPLMLAIGVLAGAPWLVEPLLASLSLGLVFLLGRTVYGQTVGLLAAGLGLTSPFWLFLGSSFMSHATGMFFVTGCYFCFAKLEKTSRGRWAAGAGFCAGMALLTRQATAIGALGPLLLYALFWGKRSRRSYIPAVIGFAVPLGFLLLYDYVQMGDPFQTTYAAWDPRWLFGFGPHGQPGPASGDPFTAGDGVWNDYQNLAMLSAQLFGWPYAMAPALAVIPFLAGRARRFDWLLLASFAGLVLIHTFYWSAGLMYGPRYYYEGLPALLLLTARGIEELCRLPYEIRIPFTLTGKPVIALLFPGVLLITLFWFSLALYMPAQMRLYNNYNYSTTTELTAVARRHVHHALVFVVSEPAGFWASYGNVFFANDPRLRGDVVFVRDEGARDRFLYSYFPKRRYYRLSGAHLVALK